MTKERSGHFPAEFPKECLVKLIGIATSDPTQLVSPEAVEEALYASGCLNAMRFPEMATMAIPPWVIPLAMELIQRIISQYWGTKTSAAESEMSTEDLCSKLNEALK